MRTTKRFTPALLDRFERLGRGTGTYADYSPWHRATRSEPSSSGATYIHVFGEGRHIELLSTGELVTFFFLSMLPHLLTSAEQLPLSLVRDIHEALAYDTHAPAGNFPGTVEIAAALGIRHPTINGGGRSRLWRMTSDNVAVIREPNRRTRLLAISCKATSYDKLSARDIEKARIEREYWRCRGEDWLLITPAEYGELLGIALRKVAPWALHPNPGVTSALLEDVTSIVSELRGAMYRDVFKFLSGRLGSMELAQAAFWKAVWSGRLPIDLRGGWHATDPVWLLSRSDFLALNPLSARRSAWKD